MTGGRAQTAYEGTEGKLFLCVLTVLQVLLHFKRFVLDKARRLSV